MRPEIVVEDVSSLLESMLVRFAALANAAQSARERFTVAVPGGSVAEAFFPKLATARLDWRRTHVFWVDERCVAATHSESNYGRARVLWLDPVRIDPQHVHDMAGEVRDLDVAAAAMERDLVAALGIPPQVDLALLGVGHDGHVASLFPGHPALDERSRYVRGIEAAPKPPSRRLTWTLPALAAARALWVVAFGALKSEPVQTAVQGARTGAPSSRPGPPSPLEYAVRSGPPVTLFLDREAGRGLVEESPPPNGRK